jgi:hypothetical protein
MGWLGWPPKDPPMFWITLATFVAVLVYVWFTRQQVNVTDDASYITNRPYVIWAGEQLRSHQNKTWQIGEGFQNFGKTPAIDLKMHTCEPMIRDTDQPPAFSCTESNAPMENPTVLGPTQIRGSAGAIIADDVLSATMERTKFVYVFGYLTYADNLRHEQHLTRFCHRIEQLQVTPTPPGYPPTISIGCITHTWNCVDEDCPSLTTAR